MIRFRTDVFAETNNCHDNRIFGMAGVFLLNLTFYFKWCHFLVAVDHIKLALYESTRMFFIEAHALEKHVEHECKTLK